MVPHGQNLTEIRERGVERLTCILCKRLMYRVAERIAELEHAEGIVTGEVIGEHASQTLPNLRVLTSAIQHPIYRPLLGLDKVQIEQLARKIGTYELSTQPVTECTAVPRRPSTRARLVEVEEVERRLDVWGMVERSLKSMRVLHV